MKREKRLIMVILSTFALIGCGGGSSTKTTVSTTESLPTATQETEDLTGSTTIATGEESGPVVATQGTDGATDEGSAETPVTTPATTQTTTTTQSVSSIPFPTLPTNIDLGKKYIPPQL